MKRIALLIGLILLAGCQTEAHLISQQQHMDNAICIKRGGDYENCRMSLIEERSLCLRQWYALPPEMRTKLTLQKHEDRPAGIRACNALGV